MRVLVVMPLGEQRGGGELMLVHLLENAARGWASLGRSCSWRTDRWWLGLAAWPSTASMPRYTWCQQPGCGTPGGRSARSGASPRWPVRTGRTCCSAGWRRRCSTPGRPPGLPAGRLRTTRSPSPIPAADWTAPPTAYPCRRAGAVLRRRRGSAAILPSATPPPGLPRSRPGPLRPGERSAADRRPRSAKAPSGAEAGGADRPPADLEGRSRPARRPPADPRASSRRLRRHRRRRAPAGGELFPGGQSAGDAVGPRRTRAFRRAPNRRAPVDERAGRGGSRLGR